MFLTRVKTTLSWPAHRRTARLLDGEYASVFHGHSLDFDDLRQYVPGDAVRDIDWKATARGGTPLVRRFVASRQHRLCLVLDTGRDSGAVTAAGELKRDLAVHLSGLAGYLAIRHGDDVQAVLGDAAGTTRTRPATSEVALEHLLRRLHERASSPSAASRLGAQLDFLARTERGRMLVLIVADESSLGPDDERLLRRLRAQHEVSWVTLRDADLETALPGGAQDVDERHGLPRALSSDPALWKAYRSAEAERRAARVRMLRRLGIPYGDLASRADALPALMAVIARRRHASR